jgi:hypothetical protein
MAPPDQVNGTIWLDELNGSMQDAKIRHDKDTAVLLGEEESRLRVSTEELSAELARATEVLETLQIVEQQQQKAGAVPPDELQVRPHPLLSTSFVCVLTGVARLAPALLHPGPLPHAVELG